jgi:hypothetical protein
MPAALHPRRARAQPGAQQHCAIGPQCGYGARQHSHLAPHGGHEEPQCGHLTPHCGQEAPHCGHLAPHLRTGSAAMRSPRAALADRKRRNAVNLRRTCGQEAPLCGHLAPHCGQEAPQCGQPAPHLRTGSAAMRSPRWAGARAYCGSATTRRVLAVPLTSRRNRLISFDTKSKIVRPPVLAAVGGTGVLDSMMCPVPARELS